MTDIRYRLPNEVATQLQISPSTLRRWSTEFAEFLTDAAGRPEPADGGSTTHRRYSDEDLEALMTIKGLLAEGLTYTQVCKRLDALRLRQTSPDEVTVDDPSEVTALAASPWDTSYTPTATVLADTLHTVADGQQLLLNSQQANRDLLTVLLQDNFNLKEENSNLRDRMLELERDLAEIRRLEAGRRDAMEARFQKLEATVLRPPPAPAPSPEPKPAERTGCLGQIFG
ncbi:MerR family transcriptional regulator [Chloroflexota bacterium]